MATALPGSRSQDRLEAGAGFLKPAHVAQRQAAIAPGFGKARLKRQRPLVTRQRFIRALEVPQRHAAIVPQFGVVPVSLSHRVEHRQRILGGTFQIEQHHAPIVHRLGEIGLEGKCAVIIGQRFGRPSQRAPRQAATIKAITLLGCMASSRS